MRDDPTYEEVGDPLEARRRKRREEREKAGVSRDAVGNGAGRGRQYISSFEVADKKVRVYDMCVSYVSLDVSMDVSMDVRLFCLFVCLLAFMYMCMHACKALS